MEGSVGEEPKGIAGLARLGWDWIGLYWIGWQARHRCRGEVAMRLDGRQGTARCGGERTGVDGHGRQDWKGELGVIALLMAGMACMRRLGEEWPGRKGKGDMARSCWLAWMGRTGSTRQGRHDDARTG